MGRKEQQRGERNMMDTDQDRIEGEKVARLLQDGLLNKVYEVQCEREKQFNLISQMMKMSVSPFQPQDSTNTSSKQQEMEVNGNQAYVQYMMERSMMEDNYCNPHDQQVKRSDPVYLASMASHGVWHPDQQHLEQQHSQQYHLELQHQQQKQLELQQHQQQQLELQHQQQLELQQRSCQNQILAEQLGGFVLPTRQSDIIPLMDSMQIE